jgi:glutamate dehydrogenase (NAD(P)+)
MNYYWTQDDVLQRLDTKLTEAFNKVLVLAAKEGIYMRDAAYMVAIGAVVEAMELRGWL